MSHDKPVSANPVKGRHTRFFVTALRKRLLAAAGFCLVLGAHAAGPITVNATTLTQADTHPDVWMSVARTYSEQRYSPLDQINAGNVDKLGLAWSQDMDSRRGLEATPLVVNGVVYTTGTWSRVYALDAKTGKLLWSYGPKVPRAHAVELCCDVVNRGVALWQGRVFFGTLDGRLIALDAKTGKLNWSVVTVDQSKPYSITAAPRVIGGKVLIGNGGAEFAGVRGYLSAYDANDGHMLWRFYTVPGNHADNNNSPALAAVKTWSKAGWWRLGGGGPVWNDLAYDPKLNLLYFGTGNAIPWNRYVRNAEDVSGDDLYTASIMAINPDTGQYVWHFQTTPGDAWDYDSDEHLILADIKIDGTKQSVIMQANKNGFFYVLDRNTGDFISGNNFAEQNWAKGLDPKTGRPIPEQSPYDGGQGKLTWPSPFGAHNWQGGSFSPKTGLVYIPANDVPFLYQAEQQKFKAPETGWDTGLNLAAGALPPGMDPLLQTALIQSAIAGKLIAWDPAKQRAAWTVNYPMPWNGGTLATAGNLVFQGTADGRFVAYNAGNGDVLWQHKLPNGIIAAPITYRLDGQQ